MSFFNSLLSSLLGYSSSYIILHPITKLFKLSTILINFNQADIGQINKILKLADQVRKCNKYIKMLKYNRMDKILYEDDNDDELVIFKYKKVNVSKGIYTLTLLKGVESIVNDYKVLIADIEKHLSNEKELPLSSIQLLLEPYYSMFITINKIIDEYITTKYHGAAVLNLLYQSIFNTTGLSSIASKRLFTECYKLLWNQLSSWIQYGILDSNKFFISEIALNSNLSDWFSQLSIKNDYLPTNIISYDLAVKILFIGRAVKILHPASDPSKGLIPQSDRNEIAKVIHILCTEDINIDKLESEIQKVYTCIMSHLWIYLKEKSKLMDYIHAMKRYYLLSNGELFSIFIQETAKLMERPPAFQAEKELNDGAFSSALNLLGLEDDPYMCFRLCIHPSSLDHNYSKLKNETYMQQVKDELNFCGTSSFYNNNCIRLVSDAPDEVGAVWSNHTFQVDHGFKASFQFSMSKMTEGFAFLIQGQSPWSLGESGTGLGYTGISASLAIEFDCHYNDYHQTNENHVAVHSNYYERNSSNDEHMLTTYNSLNRMSNNQLRNVMIELKTGILRVAMDHVDPQNENDMKDIISCSFDIHKLRPEAGRMWFGFTATSSELTEEVLENTEHDGGIMIYSLSFLDNPYDENTSLDPWRRIGMICSLTSPLPLIFSATSLARYDSIFRFLFTIKRVQFHLQQLWKTLMKFSKLTKESNHHRTLLSLRSRMQFLIDNLQFYIQVDVIEVQFAKLIASIEKAEDFESGKRCHDVFLNNLIKDSFLLSKPLHRGLENVFNLCMQLCMLVSKNMNDSWDVSSIKSLNQVDLEFKNNSSIIFTLLSTTIESVTSPHVAQLLMRLDYNRHFSNSVNLRPSALRQ